MRRTLRILGIALPTALAITAVVVLPGWLPILPRSVQRGLTEGLLQGTLFFYAALVVAGLIGTPWFGRRTIRAWRAKRRGTRSERLFLLCLSCLVSLVVLEAGAVAVRAWTHRFPVLPTSFSDDESDTAYRILVLGGSSALGEPYRPWVSVGQIVAWKLGEAMSERRFEPEILAWLGDSLEAQHQKFAQITHRPDAVIIYSGHNEFAWRFEENRDYTLDPAASWAIARAMDYASSISPFRRLIRELISKNRLDAPPSLKGRHQLIDPPLCDPAEYAEILADFSARLEAIVAYCERIGAQPILIIPPANEADYEPSRSTAAPGTSPANLRRLADKFRTARSLLERDPARAEAMLRAILDRHPEFAEAHYRLGRLLEALGRTDEARERFLAALDRDGLPIRCPEPFRAAYRRVAERHPAAILIDGRRELIEAGSSGLLGDDMIEDTHHPNLKGQAALAAAVLRELKRREAFGPSSAAIEAPDVAACAARFDLDAEKLAEACERTSVHYERAAGYRYDPSERLAKSRRFAEAARRLRAGASIQDVGLPAFDFEDVRK